MTSLRRMLLAAIAVLLSCQAWADVYRYIDKDGNMVLTDQKVPGAVLVKVPPTMTMPFPKDAAAAPAASSGKVAKPSGYVITIASPAPESTFQRNSDQAVPIAVSVEPSLKAGLSLELLLDGSHFDGDALPLDQITRGAHSVSARIIDATGKVVQDGPGATFYVRQATVDDQAQKNNNNH